MLSWFIEKNKKLSGGLERLLPQAFTRSFLYLHETKVKELAASSKDALIVDVGGGKSSLYGDAVNRSAGSQLLGLDISLSELQQNKDVDFKIVANAASSLPLKPQSVDIIVTRSVIEHLSDVDTFIDEAYSALKPNGIFINVLPCKFSPFSAANQILPNSVARFLLFLFHPAWKSEVGFRSYYDKCYHAAMMKSLSRRGFTVIEMKVRYYQSIYYNFFFPLYLLFVIYDMIIWTFKLQNLGAQLYFIARKG